MDFRERLKRNSGVIFFLLGSAIAWFLMPDNWVAGVIVLSIGMAFGDIDSQLNPRIRAEKGPNLPWDKMGSGEKFEYFFSSVVFIVIGVVLLGLALETSRIEFNTGMLLSASGLILVGCAQGWMRWNDRYS